MIRAHVIERSVRWGGVVVCLLIVAVAGLSSVRAVFWISPSGQYTCELHLGAVFVTWWHNNNVPRPFPTDVRGWHTASFAGAPPVGFHPWLPAWHSSATLKRLVVPVWVIFAACALPTLALWYRDWRRRHRVRGGHCDECGYDLTGNTSGQCPECGHTMNR